MDTANPIRISGRPGRDPFLNAVATFIATVRAREREMLSATERDQQLAEPRAPAISSG